MARQGQRSALGAPALGSLPDRWLLPSVLLAFVAVHGQQLLFFSNQSAYFLRALTNLGYGFLKDDWLATTADATPAFTFLLYRSIALASPAIVYVYYAVLVAVFAYSIVGIARSTFPTWDNTMAAAFVLVIAVLGSGAFGIVTQKAFGVDVTELLFWGFAGQFALARYFQPSAFSVLLVLSMYVFVRGRWAWAVILLAAGVTFHQSSVIAGALLTVGYMLVALRVDHAPKVAVKIGGLAVILVAPITLYTLLVMTPGPNHAEALRILVDYRGPHHAVVASWIGWDDAVRCILLMLGWYVARQNPRVAWVLGALIVGMAALTGLQVVTGSRALALTFPWRVSAVAVPVCCCLVIAAILTRTTPWVRQVPARSRAVAIYVAVAGLMVVAVLTEVRWWKESITSRERPVMDFVERTRAKGDRYVVPLTFAGGGFRVETGVPILVDFKTTPIGDDEVLEWKRRVSLVEEFYAGKGEARCAIGAHLARNERVTHVLFDGIPGDRLCPSDSVTYERDGFLVIRLGQPKGR